MALNDAKKPVPFEEVSPELPVLTNFSVMKNQNSISWPIESDSIALKRTLFENLLRLALEHVRVDERFYLRLYPDVVDAVKKGAFASPRHHYVEFGYFEDRLPFRIEVDEEFYFRSNPDIKEGVSKGLIPSAQVHFERHGYKEGRLPREGWSLLGN